MRYSLLRPEYERKGEQALKGLLGFNIYPCVNVSSAGKTAVIAKLYDAQRRLHWWKTIKRISL